MNQQPLENIFTSPQMQASHASGLISVSETSFQQLPTMAQQLLPMLPSYPPPVAIYRLLRFGLALPTTSATIWFRDIASNFCFRQALQGVVTVISLIGHYLSWPFRLYLLTYFLVVSDAGDFGNVFPRLRQGFQNRLRVARSAAGHGYGHHRSLLEISASGSCGFTHSSFDPFWARLRSNFAKSSRVGVAIPDSCASRRRNSS